MGDIAVLTPNTIQISVYVSGCVRSGMCWVTKGQGRERNWREMSYNEAPSAKEKLEYFC